VPLLPHKHYSHSKPFFMICLLLFLLIISGIFISSLMAFNYAMNAYTTYTTLRTEANDGVQHLLKVKTIFTGLKTHPTGFLDVNKLHLAQKEFVAAHKDFQQVQYTLDHAAIVATVNQYLPQYRSQITATRAVSQIGIDVA